MRIGVDIDGVMYKWDPTARFMLREILPDSPYRTPGDPLEYPSTDWNYIADNVAPEHWKWLWTEGVRLGLFRHGNLYPGTIKAIEQLSKLGDIIAITHRPKAAVADTLAWLSFHRFPLSGFHILTGGETKTSVARCDFYIDDKMENCAELARLGVTAMPDRPWNRKETPEGVIRTYDWSDFIDLVQAAA